MPRNYIDRFVEVLNSTFSACDKNEQGYVETNRLVDFLISQEPSWMDNETIREEFNKVLQGDLNCIISKEDFITSLQGWFEASLSQQINVENDRGYFDSEDGKCSSSTSGIGEPSEIASGNSADTMEEIYSGTNFVSDEQTFTNEDLVDEASLNDSGSSQTEPRLVKVLQSEISTLLRKKECLENLKDSLLGQVSCLEDTLGKMKKESKDYKRQLLKTSNRLELQIQKQKETEDRINLVCEENKSMTTLLSQFEKENKKLKTVVSNLEEKLERSSSEDTEKTTKLKELTDKFNKLNDLYNNSIKMLSEERENFRFKETERENALREVISENINLQSQLDSNTSYTKDMKSKLRAALKKLSDVQSTRVASAMEADNSCSPLTDSNSLVFFDGNFSLDKTIPFETSLLAELKDEVESKKRECCCVCKQNVPLNLSYCDVSVGTCTIDSVDKATMTTFDEHLKCDFCSNVVHKDVGVECSLKGKTQILEDRKISLFCFIKSKRSVKKWISLFGVILILCLLLIVFLFSYTFLSLRLRCPHKSMSYFTYFYNVQVKDLDIFLPIK